MSVPDQSQFVQSFIRSRLKRVEGDQEATRTHSFEVLNACCTELYKGDSRWGLLEKKGGARVRDRAADILAYDLSNGTCQLLDVITDAEGADGMPGATWREVDPATEAGIRPISQWKAPYTDVVIPPIVIPPKDPPETPPSNNSDELVRRLADLEKKVWDLERQLADGQEVLMVAKNRADDAFKRAESVSSRVDKLKLAPAPELPDSAAIPTNSAWGHGHRIKARIE